MISKPEISARLRPTIAALGAIISVLPIELGHAQSDDTCSKLLFTSDVQLAVTMEMAIDIYDEVRDGCWPRPESAKNVVELELLNNGVSVVESGYPTPTLILHGLGYDVSQGTSCAVTISLYLMKPIISTVPYSANDPEGDLLHNVAEYRIWTTTFIMTGAKSGMQDEIKNAFEEAAEAFILDYRKAQSALFKVCPRMRSSLEKASSKTE